MRSHEDTFSRPKAPNTLPKKVRERLLNSTMSLHKEWNASVTSLTSSDADNSIKGLPSDTANSRPGKRKD